MDIKEIVKELAPVVEQTIKDETATIKSETEATLKTIEDELKTLKLNAKLTGVDEKELKKKTQEIMSKTFSQIAGSAQVSVEQFKQVFETNVKNAYNSEGTAGEGAELVFTQFSQDVITVMKQYKLVNELKIYAIKGNELKIPKGVNNVTTAWVAEGGAIGKSKLGTSFITINTYKAATLVPFTEELLKDNMSIPDYYALIVSMIGESQGAFLENEVINGTDATQIEGILVNASVNIATAGATKTTLRGMTFDEVDNLLTDADGLIGAEFETNPENSVAVMSKYVLNKLTRLKLTTGAYAYPELRGANPMLLGKYRVLVSHKAPMQNQAADVAGATFVVFGNFKNYFGLAISEDLTLTRGYADGDFEADLQSVKARRRAGGKALFGEAFAKCKTAAA